MKGLPPGWQTDIIKGLGGSHSAGAEHLLGAWQQWEGGGTANDADFNPLNTTIGGYKKINSVGVSAFPDWQTGVQETVNTLKAYPALSEALRTGNVDFANPALQADLNYWLSGKRTPGMTPYVSKIARSFGQNVPLSETKATKNTVYNTPPTAPVPPPITAASLVTPKQISLMDIALGKRSIMDMFFQKRPSAAKDPAMAAASAATTAMAGQDGWTPMGGQSKWGSLKTTPGSPVPGDKAQSGWGHGTSGLKGYSGNDFFAKAGSPAVAPVSGKVVRLSGHDPKLGAVEGAGGPLGWSVYIQGDDGHSYYLTHMGSRTVQEGQTVKMGQPIGTVADYDSFGRPSHIHMGVE